MQMAANLGMHPNTIARFERNELPIPVYIELAIEALLNRAGLKPVIIAAKKTATKKGKAKK